MSRRSPASNCNRSQDSFSPQPIALKTMLSRQDDDDEDDEDDDDDNGDCAAGLCPALTGLSPVTTRASSARLFGIAAASGWQRGVKSCTGAVPVPLTAGATRSLTCFSFTACGGAISRTARAAT